MHLTQRRARLARTNPGELGARIKSARIAAGLTQGVVAQGYLSVGYLSRIESGQRRPDVAVLDVIAGRLDLDLDQLLAADEPAVAAAQPVLDFAEIAVGLGDAKSALDHLDTLDPTRLSAADTWRVDMVRAQAFEATGDLDGAIEMLEGLEARDAGEHSRMKLGMALCRCYREHGEYTNAIRAGETPLGRAKDLGLEACDESVQLTVSVALAYFERGDRDHAVRMCRRAVATAEEVGSVTARGAAYWNASIMTMEQGQVADAVPLARRALALFSEGSDNRNTTRLRAQVGLMELRLNPPQVAQAREHLGTAWGAMQMSHATQTELLWTRLGLARCSLLEGDLAQAQEEVTALLTEATGTTPLLEADVLRLAAQVADARGDLEGARARLLESVHHLSAAGNDRAAAERWMDLAALLESVHESEAAKDAYRAAAVTSGLQPRLVPTSPSTAVLVT